MIAIWRAGLRRWLAPGLGVALTVVWCVAGAPAPPAAAATTTITVNGTQGGRTFDGIGAIYFQVASTGAWSIFRNNTSGMITTLASGTVAALGTGTWHHLALSLNGRRTGPSRATAPSGSTARAWTSPAPGPPTAP